LLTQIAWKLSDPAFSDNLVEIKIQRLEVGWRRNPPDWIPKVACNDSAIEGTVFMDQHGTEQLS
jgi:hypothetical protein